MAEKDAAVDMEAGEFLELEGFDDMPLPPGGDADAEDLPAEAEDVPADVEDVPADAEDVPADVEDVPADAEDVPADAEDPERKLREYEAGLAAMRAEMEALKARQYPASFPTAPEAPPAMPTEEEWAEDPNAAYRKAFEAQTYQQQAAQQAQMYRRRMEAQQQQQFMTGVAVRMLPDLARAGTEANKRYVELWNDPGTGYQRDPRGPIELAIKVQEEIRRKEDEARQAESARRGRVRKGHMVGAGQSGANTARRPGTPSDEDKAMFSRFGLTTPEARKVYMQQKYGRGR